MPRRPSLIPARDVRRLVKERDGARRQLSRMKAQKRARRFSYNQQKLARDLMRAVEDMVAKVEK